jgi:hypothetical protein
MRLGAKLALFLMLGRRNPAPAIPACIYVFNFFDRFTGWFKNWNIPVAALPQLASQLHHFETFAMQYQVWHTACFHNRGSRHLFAYLPLGDTVGILALTLLLGGTRPAEIRAKVALGQAGFLETRRN